MVYFYYGRAGTGKTEALFDIAAGVSGRVFFVVPEQLSMTRERTVSERGLKNVTVLNFSRLANTVFRTLGGTSKKHPDAAMNAAAVCLAVERVYDDLHFYKSIAKTSGFITKLIDTFSDFDVNCVTEARVMAIPDDILPRMSRDKYRDLFLIYNEYKKLWSDDYKAPGDDLAAAADLLELNDIFTDAVFIFDGFNGFTEAQLVLMQRLVTQAPDTYFAFTTDLEDAVFSTVTLELERVRRMCENAGEKTLLHMVGDKNHRAKAKGICHLERNIFSMDPPSKKISDGITVFAGKNVSAELSYIACQIKNDVLDKKYRYRDIAVLVPDADSLVTVASAVFEKHGVPVYADIRRTLLSKPLTAFVLNALKTVTDGFEFENIFAFLKTGLTGIDFDDISLMENYVRMWRIKPSGFEREWTASPSGLSPYRGDTDALQLERLNTQRARAVIPLTAFGKRIRSAKTCRDMLVATVRLLEDFDVAHNLENIADAHKRAGDLQEYEDTLRVYGVFIDMLDSIDAVVSDVRLTPRRFCDMLSVCASSVDVTSRPSRADEVIFAGIGRVRAEGKKCIYIPCLNEGVIPAPLSERSLITEADKRVFMNVGIHVSNDFMTSVARERFDFYSALCSASEKLVFSYSRFEITGEKRLESEFLKSITAVTDAKEITQADLSPEFYLVSLSAAADLVADSGDDGAYRAITELCGFDTKPDLPRDTALEDSVIDGLYSKNLRLSFSAIEEYINCPFRFFLNRGLAVGINEPVDFKGSDIGTFMHHGLERLLKETDVSTADTDTVITRINEISEDYYNTELADCKGMSARFDALFERARTALVSAALNVVYEIQNSDFCPTEFEVSIADYIPETDLGGGYSLSLTGFIDRVDTADTEDGKLVKILDYKSGPQPFSLKKIYNGISMQLPIYGGAIRAKRPDVTVAAMYYLGIGYPFVTNGFAGLDKEGYARALAENYTRDGVFLTGDAFRHVDRTGTVIGKLKKDSLADDEKMNLLLDHAMQKLHTTARQVSKGNVAISPVKDTGVNACKYCKFGDICKISSTPEKLRPLEKVPKDFLKPEVKK